MEKVYEDKQATPIKRMFNVPMFIGRFTHTARVMRNRNTTMESKEYSGITEDVSVMVERMMQGFERLNTDKKWQDAYKELCKLESQITKCNDKGSLLELSQKIIKVCETHSVGL